MTGKMIGMAGGLCAVIAILLLAWPQHSLAQTKEPALTKKEKAIVKEIGGLRALPDDRRARTTRQLALQIRQLPVTPNKVQVALDLASLSTEGDFGRDTLQEVTTTLASALRERPMPPGA